jgi:hypothetical protein
MSVEIVVAKYKENCEWTKKLKHPVTIYDKSDTPLEGSISRPNIGREGETFLYHIIQNYDKLADVTVFLQGAPFEHLQTLVGWRADLTDFEKETVLFKLNNELNFNSPFSTFYQVLYNVKDGNNNCPLIYYFEKIFGIKKKKKKLFTVSPGAQFVVPKKNILARPKTFYEKLHSYIVGNDSFIFGYTLEVLWYYIYKGQMNYNVGNHDEVKKENEHKAGFQHSLTSYNYEK